MYMYGTLQWIHSNLDTADTHQKNLRHLQVHRKAELERTSPDHLVQPLRCQVQGPACSIVGGAHIYLGHHYSVISTIYDCYINTQ